MGFDPSWGGVGHVVRARADRGTEERRQEVPAAPAVKIVSLASERFSP